MNFFLGLHSNTSSLQAKPLLEWAKKAFNQFCNLFQSCGVGKKDKVEYYMNFLEPTPKRLGHDVVLVLAVHFMAD